MGSLSRPSKWYFNPLISESVQVNLCDTSYKGDTYSRGHLIPNASRNGNEEMQKQTFYVTNSVPQVQNNFNSGIWSSLEGALQSMAKGGETLYIVTGVAFNKVGETKSVSYIQAKDDTKNIPIPNYFYKIVLKVTTNSSGTVTSASTIGFWFENKAYTNSSYTSCAVSVDQVEQWTGFDFFANLPDGVETSAESNTNWSSFQNF
jgi:endonuclease G